ncbi:hypothetical protein KC19_6G142100 [Ceratodon purpureus]|uniref:Uncharacterized protein n=1 Tax=Ceratodon purpureus TaxID=3225 RepID=A0A8T0HI50_CERPU|nr:hypothetical protein KC19_6G142100 [Ceratodon purpureus]
MWWTFIIQALGFWNAGARYLLFLEDLVCSAMKELKRLILDTQRPGISECTSFEKRTDPQFVPLVGSAVLEIALRCFVHEGAGMCLKFFVVSYACSCVQYCSFCNVLLKMLPHRILDSVMSRETDY